MIIFLSFQVGLNFLIRACLFLCFKNALKKFSNFFIVFLLQINIFDVFVFFLSFLKYIEIEFGHAARPKENILSQVPLRVRSCARTTQNSFESSYSQTHQPCVMLGPDSLALALLQDLILTWVLRQDLVLLGPVSGPKTTGS